MKAKIKTIMKLPYLRQKSTILKTLHGKVEIINRNEVKVIDPTLKDIIFKIENGDEFLSEKEAAKFIGISVLILQKLNKENFIPSYSVKKLDATEQRFYSKNDLLTVNSYSVSTSGIRLIELYKEVMDMFLKMATLTEREEMVLSNFNNGKTIEEIAITLGVSYERVRQIKDKSMRKLIGRISRRNDEYLVAVKENELLRNSIAEKNNIIKFLREGIVSNQKTVREEESNQMYFSTKLVDLDSISVRALNAFKAADLETLGDLYRFTNDLKDVRELLKFRNFGKKTMEETIALIKRLDAIGYDNANSDEVKMSEFRQIKLVDLNLSTKTIKQLFHTKLSYLFLLEPAYAYFVLTNSRHQIVS